MLDTGDLKFDYHKLFIQSLSLRGESVTIMNCGMQEVPLSKLRIRSDVGKNQIFAFPGREDIEENEDGSLKSYILHPGCTTTVWSGSKATHDFHNPPNSFVWTKRNMWNNKGDSAVLETIDGDFIHQMEGNSDMFYADIGIQRVDMNNQCITIVNGQNQERDVSRWTILVAGSGGAMFSFPDKSILKPGTTLTLWLCNRERMSKAKYMECPPYSLLWKQKFFSLSWKGDAVALYDDENNRISSVCIFPDKLPLVKNNNNKDHQQYPFSSYHHQFNHINSNKHHDIDNVNDDNDNHVHKKQRIDEIKYKEQVEKEEVEVGVQDDDVDKKEEEEEEEEEVDKKEEKEEESKTLEESSISISIRSRRKSLSPSSTITTSKKRKKKY